MKPIELTMEAFGSYGQKTKIRFDRDDLRLFLVAGDTGSGKSTIFDAMTFALYGEASASDASGKKLYSHYGRGDNACVTFTFSHGRGEAEKIYKVERRPSRPRPRGETLQDPEAVLTADGEDAVTGKNVTKRIESILGLTKEQFMQIGMLAQGEFRRLLRAKSDAKGVILSKLFNTGIYEKIQTEIKAQAGARAADVKNWWSIVKGVASQAHVPEDLGYEGRDRVKDLQTRIEAQKDADIKLIEDMVHELSGLVAFEDDTFQKVTKAVGEAQAELDKAAKAYQEAKQLTEAFEAAEKEEAAYKVLKDQHESKEKLLALADQLVTAFRIQAAWGVLETAQAEWKKVSDDLQKERGRLLELKRSAEAAVLAEKSTQTAFEASVRKQAAISRKYEDAEKQFAVISEMECQLKGAQATLQHAQTDQKNAEQELAKLLQDSENRKKEMGRLKDTGVLLERRQTQQKSVEDAARAFSLCVEREKSAAEAAKKFISAKKSLDKLQEKYDKDHQAFYSTYAGVLAEELEPGKPCPVCGSTEHPHPHVRPTGVTAITEDELKKEEEAASAARSKMEAASIESHKAQAEAEAAQEAAEGSTAAARQMAEELGLPVPDDTNKLLEGLAKRIRKDITALKRDVKRAAQLEKDAAEAEELQEKLRKTQQDSSLAAVRANGDIRQAEQAILTARKDLEFESLKDAEAELKREERSLKTAEDAKNEAADKRSAADKALTNSEAQIKALEKRLPELNEKREAEQNAYLKSMEDAKMNEDEWRTLAREHTEQDIEAYRKEHQQFMEQLHTREGALRAAQAKVEGREKPSLAPLQEKEQSARELWTRLQEKKGGLSAHLDVHKKTLRDLSESAEEYDTVVKAALMTKSLSDRLNGNQSREHVKLETFVQRVYFKTILQAANRRFSDMTGKQFELRLIELEDAGSGRTDNGLDITVYSHTTGKTRDIRTLSGGESFMAALSLALGMSDVIEQQSAVSLDMMFIDEGFGSLDDNARREAVRILQQITGGNKLIGIISHVTELKHEIDDQLIVTKDSTGSHAEWNTSGPASAAQ